MFTTSDPAALLPGPPWAGVDVKAAAAIVLVASRHASQIARGSADIAEDANISRASPNVIGTARTANPTVMAPAAARGIDPDPSIVARDMVDRGAQPCGKAAAVGAPVDTWGASRDGEARRTSRDTEFGTCRRADRRYCGRQARNTHGLVGAYGESRQTSRYPEFRTCRRADRRHRGGQARNTHGLAGSFGPARNLSLTPLDHIPWDTSSCSATVRV